MAREMETIRGRGRIEGVGREGDGKGGDGVDKGG